MDLVTLIHEIMQWIVAPVAAFVWFNYLQIQSHKTDIAVLKANTSSLKEAHEREMTELRENTRVIMSKLDSIEQALRK